MIRDKLTTLKTSHDRLRSEVLALNSDWAFRKMMRALKTFTRDNHFNPEQPRDWHGRWTTEAGSSRVQLDQNFDVTQLEMGSLLGQAPIHASRGGGVDCFYRFSFGIVAVPGPNSRVCWQSIPWFGATHGRLIKGVK